MSFATLRPENHSSFIPSVISGSTEEQWQCSDPTVPIWAPSHQVLPTCEHQVYDPSMSGLETSDVPEVSGDLVHANLFRTGESRSQIALVSNPLGVSHRPTLDRNSNYVLASNTPSSGVSTPKLPNNLRSACDNCMQVKKCSSGQSCDRCQSLKESCSYSVQEAISPVREDAIDLSVTRRFSNDEWNDIFMRSETGNGLAFPALGEAPIVNMVHAQETFGELKPATASREELRNRKQKEQVPSPLEPIIENTELHEANDYKRFQCLFQQCNRATSVPAFPSKRSCYRHMKDIHRFADSFHVYLKLIDRQELMDRQAQ